MVGLGDTPWESSPLIFLNFSSSGVRMEEHNMQKPLGFPHGTRGVYNSMILKSSYQRFCIHVCRLRKAHQLENGRSHVAEGAVLHALDLVTGIDNNELNRIE